MSEPRERITRLLSQGTPESAAELLPLVYDELRRLAQARIAREKPGHTLQPTALVHEAWLRIAGNAETDWNGRRHFFGAAAEAMRRILIDRARNKRRSRRGGGAQQVEFDDADAWIEPPSDDLLAVEEALATLEAADPRAREIVNLRYFTGLTNQETADAMGVSLSSIEREWRFIRTFLQGVLKDDGDPDAAD